MPALWYRFLLRRGTRDAKRRAATVLATSTGRRTTQALIRALEDRDVREIAAQALGTIADPIATEPLLRCMSSDRWSATAAGKALVQIQNQAALEGLIALLGSSDEKIFRAAADALSEFDDPLAKAALLGALQQQNNHSMIVVVADALFKSGWEPDRTQSITLAIARRKYREAAKAGADAVALLLKEYRNEHLHSIEDALLEITDPAAGPVFIEYLQDSKSWEVQRIAIEALRRLRESRAIPHLFSLISHPDSYTRSLVLDALAALGWKPSSIEERISIAGAKCDFRQLLAEEPEAMEQVIKYFKSHKHLEAWSGSGCNICDSVRKAVIEMEDPAAVPALLAALKDENRSLKEIAVRALLNIRQSDSIDCILQAARTDRDISSAVFTIFNQGWQVISNLEKQSERIDMAINLGKFEVAAAEGPNAIVPLALACDDLQIPRAAGKENEILKALKSVHDASATPQFVQLLSVGSKRFREYAATRLAFLGDSVAVKPLIAALKDSELSVRQAAANALQSSEWLPSTSEERVIFAFAAGHYDRVTEMGYEAVQAMIDTVLTLEKPNTAAAKILGHLGDPRAADALISALERDFSRDVFYDFTIALLSLGSARSIELLFVPRKGWWGFLNPPIREDKSLALSLIQILRDARGKIPKQALNQILDAPPVAYDILVKIDEQSVSDDNYYASSDSATWNTVRSLASAALADSKQ